MRVIVATVTPVPSCAPSPVSGEIAGIAIGGFGLQHDRLARIAFGVGVGDVVAGDVERLLLGDQAAERRLQSL